MRVAYALAAFLEAASLAGGRRKRPDLTRFGVILLALEYREDASKLKRLGWEAKVPLAEAIRRCSEWSRREQPEPARR
jgi:nucleoside-diphosphate-sugar epimerase